MTGLESSHVAMGKPITAARRTEYSGDQLKEHAHSWGLWNGARGLHPPWTKEGPFLEGKDATEQKRWLHDHSTEFNILKNQCPPTLNLLTRRKQYMYGETLYRPVL